MDIYGPFAEHYDRLSMDFIKTLENDFRRKILAQFVLPNSNVLDLGCGTAPTYFLLNKPKNYTGVDVSSAMLEVARSKLPEESDLLCHDLSKGPITFEESFDSVVSMYGSLSHLAENELSSLLKNAYHALRPGGSLIIDLMNKYSLERLVTRKWNRKDYCLNYLSEPKKVNIEFYTPQHIKKILETAGLEVLLITSSTVIPARGLGKTRPLLNKYKTLGRAVYRIEEVFKKITDSTGPRLGRALIVVARKP